MLIYQWMSPLPISRFRIADGKKKKKILFIRFDFNSTHFFRFRFSIRKIKIYCINCNLYQRTKNT